MSLAPSPHAHDIPLNLYRVSHPGIARVLSNERLTPERCDDVRHIVLDLSGLDYRYLEGQSLGVLTPGLDDRGRPNKLRLYSIASTRLGDDGSGRTASLCVKRVVYADPVTGEEHRGVASNYLCDLRPGDEVAVTGPSGRVFLLPDDPEAPMVLVATGTGIAPFRGFLRRIAHEAPRWPGEVHLFFGIRTAAECLYREELEAIARERPKTFLHYAFSREQQNADGTRVYVQHRMAEQVARLWEILEHDHSHLYVCGLKGMEDGILALLEQQAAAEGRPWHDYLVSLKKSGRLLVETY